MLSTIVRTLLVYAAVTTAMRLMGKRQLGELQPAELVTTFLISNVASICIEEPELPLLSSMVPILLIAALEILSSTAAWYCPGYSRLLFGKPVTVIRDGKVDQQALSELRITSVDLMEALRGKEIFTPADVAWGVIETNGSLSVAAKPTAGAPPPMLPLLVEGHLYADNLAALCLDMPWLEKELKKQGLTLQSTLIFLCNGQSSLVIRRQAATHKVKK